MSDQVNLPGHALGEREQVANAITPADVLRDPLMDKAMKRALLVSWASDRCAVVDAPGLRRLDTGAVVSLADILQALRALDEGEIITGEAAAGPVISLSYRQRARSASLGRLFGRGDDDGLPPRPAAARLPPRYIHVDARAQAA